MRKFKIDRRYIAIEILKSIVCYILGVVIVEYLFNPDDLLGFIGSSLVAAIFVFCVYGYPKQIAIRSDNIVFGKSYGRYRYEYELINIAVVGQNNKLYNTLTIRTKSGIIFKLHPQDMQALENIITESK